MKSTLTVDVGRVRQHEDALVTVTVTERLGKITVTVEGLERRDQVMTDAPVVAHLQERRPLVAYAGLTIAKFQRELQRQESALESTDPLEQADTLRLVIEENDGLALDDADDRETLISALLEKLPC